MATRSRLGRDPLQGAAKPAAKQPARKPRKTPTPAAAAGKPAVVDQSVAPACANALPLDTVAAPQSDVLSLDLVAAAHGDVLPAGPTEPAPSEIADAAPSPVLADLSPGPEASAEADAQPVPADAPDRTIAVDLSAMPDAEPSLPTRTEAFRTIAADVSDMPDESLVTEALEIAVQRVPASLPPLTMEQEVRPMEQGIHPVEVFLRGVLEGLLPEGDAALCITVDPETFALPVEKLFYFSHALQRIVTPMEYLPRPVWRPGDTTTPGLPVLTVRLRVLSADRHVLTLTDNGQFFRSRLPDIRLGMEALKPLVAFIVKRHGSVRLAQGRCITFEIIG